MTRRFFIILLFFSYFFTLSCAGVENLKASLPIKVACVGNSITYGSGLANRETESYPARLQEMLGNDYDVRNFGRPGATLLRKGHRPYIQQKEYANAKAFAADIVVIHLGINDTDPRNWPNYRDEFISDYRALIDTFRMINPKCRVLIARLTPITILHPRFESGTRDWHDEINEDIEKVARGADAQLFDLFEPLYKRPDLFPDAVHPNAEGAQIIADIVYSTITGDYGGLKMPLVYSDNMMMQYGRELTISGTANTGDIVIVKVAGQIQTTTCADNGKWSVRIDALPAGGPYTLEVSTDKQRLVYHNVLAGDVWLCSGQSNMEFKLALTETSTTDIPKANNAHIRLLNMEARWPTDNLSWSKAALDSVNQLQYLTTEGWKECSSETVKGFSAVGYYFGKILQQKLDIPIGLICNAVGGTGTESWVDRHSLEYGFPSVMYRWNDNDFIQPWVKVRAMENIKLADQSLQRHPYHPCYMFEAGILPLEHYAIKGVIWYQGESNAHNKDAHERLFKLLVNGWRQYWDQPEMPFYYTQLSSHKRPSWHWFRDSQRLLLGQLTNVGMAVCSDIGNKADVHPRRKREIGQRLAAWALNKTYGMTDVVPSGPLFNDVVFNNDLAIVSFDYAEGMTTSDGKAIRTFELAGDDGLFYPAEAKVINETSTIEVKSDKVTAPVAVRYGWQPFTDANLVNAAGLPASTFMSKDYSKER